MPALNPESDDMPVVLHLPWCVLRAACTVQQAHASQDHARGSLLLHSMYVTQCSSLSTRTPVSTAFVAAVLAFEWLWSLEPRAMAVCLSS